MNQVREPKSKALVAKVSKATLPWGITRESQPQVRDRRSGDRSERRPFLTKSQSFMNSILMESNSPTQQRSCDIKTATVREVILDTGVCDKDGYEHSATLCYHILEEDKLITECVIVMHYGSYGFVKESQDSIRESVKIMVEELEGSVDYACEIIVQ